MFNDALEQWNSASPTSQQRKREMSARAKQLNMQDKADRLENLDALSRQDESNQQREKRISRLQQSVVRAAFQSGLLCDEKQTYTEVDVSSNHQQLLPSSSRPANTGGDDTVVSCGSAKDNQIVDVAVKNSCFPVDDVIELINADKTSLHGIGDKEFAVSKSIVELATSQRAFIQRSHEQFNADHNSICEMVPDLKIDERTSLDNGFLSCEQFLGRYCRKDIGDMSKFQGSVEMLRNIVRLVMAHRSVRNGKTWHMGFDTYWPAILVFHDSIKEPLGWVAYRFCFNPLEVDFIQCDVTCIESESGCDSESQQSWRLKLKFRDVPNSNLKLPCSDRMREFATWFSQQTGSDWCCKLYLRYDLDPGPPVSLILRPHHQSASSAINCMAFESLVHQEKEASKSVKRPRTVTSALDESDDQATLLSCLQRLGVQKQKQRQSQSSNKQTTKQVNQLPLPESSRKQSVRPLACAAPNKVWF